MAANLLSPWDNADSPVRVRRGVKSVGVGGLRLPPQPRPSGRGRRPGKWEARQVGLDQPSPVVPLEGHFLGLGLEMYSVSSRVIRPPLGPKQHHTQKTGFFDLWPLPCRGTFLGPPRVQNGPVRRARLRPPDGHLSAVDTMPPAPNSCPSRKDFVRDYLALEGGRVNKTSPLNRLTTCLLRSSFAFLLSALFFALTAFFRAASTTVDGRIW